METAFRVLFQVGPLAALAGLLGTILAYVLIPRLPDGGGKPPFGRYLAFSLIAALVGYLAGSAIGIAIACSTPKGGNLCGLMGIFGVGPLLAGVAMFACAWYQFAKARQP